MTVQEFAELIFNNLPYDPTDQQVQLIAALARFCSTATPSDSVFLLNGYAGTGKTSLTGALVRSLAELEIPVVLMAPTGRAAKVFGAFAGVPASTIHRRIYRGQQAQMLYFAGEVADNPLTDAVFIVDEASMIGNDSRSDGGGNLLEDLIHYVYSGSGCRMILLGDTAQLPPVGCEVSPAMDVKVLKNYGLRVSKAVLTATVRQQADSGILYNATWLRKAMRMNPLPTPRLHLRGFNDVATVDGEELADLISGLYATEGMSNVLLVTRSNKRATQFNLAVRNIILYREEELTRDERLLVAKNNYLWSAKVKGLDFIANGDVATINAIYGTEEKYGFRFADVSVTLPDRDVDVDCKILLDTLVSDSASLSVDEYSRLYQSVITDTELFSPSTPMSARMKIARRDPYLNALQVKYAYAVTCHKAQGGQWSSVVVDMSAIPPEAQGMDFYRWLYTAITRATSRVYFLNPGI